MSESRFRDLSGLPTAWDTERAVAGDPPAANPKFAPVLASEWERTFVDRSPRKKAGDQPIRHSWAGKCLRWVQYEHMGLEHSNPMTLPGYHRVGIGNMVHQQWQGALELAANLTEFGERRQILVEKITTGRISSGHVDAVSFDANFKTVIELKSINGVGFRRAIGERGDAEGPRLEHKLQGFLSGLTEDADEVAIVYVSLENISPQIAERKGFTEPWQQFCAEWRYPREVFMPIAAAELERLAVAIKATEMEILAPRHAAELPEEAFITNPSTGHWESHAIEVVNEKPKVYVADSGKFWGCAYCSQRDRCIEDGTV